MSKKTISIALSMALTTTALLANSENMAESLMKLRSQVEQLDTRISDEKDSYKANMKSLTMQKIELEAMVSREELKIKQIEKELTQIKIAVKNSSVNSQNLTPIVNKAIENLILYIKTSLPFKTNDRIEAVTTVQNQLNAGTITPQKALSIVYNAYADEMRMTKENGIFKQTIELNGKNKLVEVARLGTAMMFFKSPSDNVGYATNSNGVWSYKEELNQEKQTQILNLFDAFKKQIRTGYFTLPNALVLSEAK